MKNTVDKTNRRRLQGEVVSNKMDKTAVVLVERTEIHPKYHKRYTTSQRYKAHDADNSAQVGDKVVIEEARPMSRDKRWRIVQDAKKSE